ncbi:phycobiliprotein lyase [Geitlerinema sp. PCC 9228]|jgi:hypothetical protein|uniref:phycobiliprotein lyase n=1 Tax=Geitlerinema sp. PCC 9228 TaxID=111611 RepID=UPI0008F9BFF4|nr:phycobiliprotein lyase [Geitlerinema sp. PCC 9228]
MLSFPDFFTACTGRWQIDRTYHYPPTGAVERSHTNSLIQPISGAAKENLLSRLTATGLQVEAEKVVSAPLCPGLTILFHTESESGETRTMNFQALFVPDWYILDPGYYATLQQQIPAIASEETDASQSTISGYYLRDEGYSEKGAVLGRFHYHLHRQSLTMTTFYLQSIAVDRMEMATPATRLRTIVSYQRPEQSIPPTQIELIGFGMERKQVL